jgi:hypothetical protein
MEVPGIEALRRFELRIENGNRMIQEVSKLYSCSRQGLQEEIPMGRICENRQREIIIAYKRLNGPEGRVSFWRLIYRWRTSFKIRVQEISRGFALTGLSCSKRKMVIGAWIP